MLETDPDNPTTAVLAAGLQRPETLLQDLPVNSPFSLNGKLFLKGEAGKIELPTYPVDWYAPAGNRVALMSETGALWLHGLDGAKTGESIPPRSSNPCFVDRAGADSLTLYGVYAAGYSACSLGFSSIEVTPDGAGEAAFIGVCSETDVPVAGREPLPISEFPEQCYERFQGGPPPESIPGLPGAEALMPLALYTFPAPIDEQTMWHAGQPLDPPSITSHMIARLGAWEGLAEAALERFAIAQFEGQVVSGWQMPDTVKTDNLSAVASLTIWGGTGGEVHEVCRGQPGAALNCREFHSFSGFNGIRADRVLPLLLIFGHGLTDEKSGEGPHNAWVAGPTEAAPTPIAGVDAFGRIEDAAFGPDGRIALLTQHAVVLVSADRQSYELMNRPANADAIEWLDDGRIVMLETTAMLHVSRPGGGIDSFEVGEHWFAAEEKRPNGDSWGTWLRESVDGRHLLVGAAMTFYVFDTALMAPITGRMTIPDPQIADAGTGLSFAVLPEGNVLIDLNGRHYQRRTGEDDLDRTSLVDADAPLR